jgi:hypothetical protein
VDPHRPVLSTKQIGGVPGAESAGILIASHLRGLSNSEDHADDITHFKASQITKTICATRQ